MLSPKEGRYAPLEADEVEVVVPRSRRMFSSPIFFKTVLFVEAVHVVLFLMLYGAFQYEVWPSPPPKKNLDGLPMAYNVSKVFTVDKEDLSLVHSTEKADKYWIHITKHMNNGLVSLPLSWAERHGLEASEQPTKPGESVFQVDLFHQLHCLQRIRSDIISAPFLNQLNPNRNENDPYFKHTLHCVDYLRQALMCNADTTLVSTGHDLEFDHSPQRQCRDFDAVADWVMRHRWEYEAFSRVPHVHEEYGSMMDAPKGHHKDDDPE